jgi:hypothetical protein
VLFLLIAVLCIPSKATDNKSAPSIASFAKYTQIPGAKEVGPDTMLRRRQRAGFLVRGIAALRNAKQGAAGSRSTGPSAFSFTPPSADRLSVESEPEWRPAHIQYLCGPLLVEAASSRTTNIALSS